MSVVSDPTEIAEAEAEAESPQALKEFEDKGAVRVFVATKDHAKTLSSEIASMYEAALGKGGVQKPGHEPYPDSDLFSAQGVSDTLTAGERLIGVAQIEEGGRAVVVGAMVADRLSPYHVEFNSMAIPMQRRGLKLGSHIVRGLSDIIDEGKFTVNCTELVTHSLASQAAHFHNGFKAICGFGFCHYPHVFFKDHPESVLWVTRLQGKIVPNLRRFRSALGRQLGKHLLDVKHKLIANQATGQVSLAAGRLDSSGYLDSGHLDSGQLDKGRIDSRRLSGRLDEESLNLLSEVLKERTAYVPKRYHDLVQSILFQFEDMLDCKVQSYVRPQAQEVADSHEARIIAEGSADTGANSALDKDSARESGKGSGRDSGNAITKSLTVDYKEGFGHSYITFKKDFVFQEEELAEAIESVHQLGKRYIKVSIPANTPEAIKAADYLIDNDFVFHSYLPLYGLGEEVQDTKDENGDEERDKVQSLVKAPEFYDVLSLQWIKPTVIKENPMPGETNSVIKLYGYPENLSGQIVRTIAQELLAIETTD